MVGVAYIEKASLTAVHGPSEGTRPSFCTCRLGSVPRLCLHHDAANFRGQKMQPLLLLRKNLFG